MRKTITKILTMAMAALMTVSLASCGNNADNTATTAKKTIAIIQQIDNGAFSDMREGFKERMLESGIDVEFKEMNAQGDATTLQTYVQNAIDEKVDMIVTIATPATQAVVSAATDIPNVFIAVSDPIGAQVLTSMEAPDKNSTGTQNPIPVEKIFSTAKTLTPNVAKYGMLYSEAQVNAVNTCKAAKAYLDTINVPYTEKTVTNSAEVQQAVQTILSDCDALFIPNDPVIQDAMPVVVEAAAAAKKPVYGSSAVMPASGALAAVAISDKEIGAQSADMAIEILNGKAVSEVSAKAVEATVTTINKTAADTLGITIPAELGAEIVGE